MNYYRLNEKFLYFSEALNFLEDIGGDQIGIIIYAAPNPFTRERYEWDARSSLRLVLLRRLNQSLEWSD